MSEHPASDWSHTHYRLLKLLASEPESSQRALSHSLGISLGKVNYCLKALIHKGWVKAKRFCHNPNKRGYAYLLTPAGVEAKARLAAHFLAIKMQEYDALQQEIQSLDQEVDAGRRAAGSSSFRLTHLGGEHQVTGSCHLLELRGLKILVDCGLVQGEGEALPMASWPVAPDKIDYLFLTHAHLDHIGRLPELISQGFHGEIITSHATKALLAPMLTDAMALAGLDEHRRERLLARIDRLSWGFEYQEDFELRRGVRFRLGRAGHILGSAWLYIEADAPRTRLVFSGDLGNRDTVLLPDPEPAPACDLLVLESTYGDRLHEGRDHRLERLGNTLSQALAGGGKVFIPAFALGRTQELLYELDRLRTAPELRQRFPSLHGASLPVVVDSPLGLKVTEIYKQLHRFWDREARALLAAGDQPLDFPGLYSARDYRDHLRLLQMEGPAVIIAGSGMCTGGRIVDHLLAGLEDARNHLLFVGYQARGTPGRDILRYAGKPDGYVDLNGVRCLIRARVEQLSGYSAHADQKGLLDWVTAMPEKPGAIKLVHGEPAARAALAAKLQQAGFFVQEAQEKQPPTQEVCHGPEGT